MTIVLINVKIELNSHEQEYDDWIKNYSSLLAELRLERQYILYLLKEQDDNNINVVFGKKKRKKCIKHKKGLSEKILIVSKGKKHYDYLIKNTK